MPPPPASRLPSLSGDAKRSYVREMFTAIAPRYDLLNHVLSLSIDRRWRRQAVDRLGWAKTPGGRYLDLCAGTLDLAVELVRRPGFSGSVIGADFVVPMLRLGRAKAPLPVVGADAVELPFPDARFDGCMIGFGVRNLVDVGRGLREIARIVKPGGRAVILECSMPTTWPIRPLYLMYFSRVLPRIGRFVSKHKNAYDYLPDSVQSFPQPERLANDLTAAGFRDVGFQRLTLGVAAIHWGTRR